MTEITNMPHQYMRLVVQVQDTVVNRRFIDQFAMITEKAVEGCEGLAIVKLEQVIMAKASKQRTGPKPQDEPEKDPQP
jgi:hypothetical protein